MTKKKKRKNRTREPSDDYEVPFELDDEVEQPKIAHKIVLAYLIDQDEVNMLINASTAEYVEPPGPVTTINQNSYSEDEVFALISGDFHPRKTKKKK